MKLSRGARRLFEHLKNLSLLEKGAIKFQRTLAAKWNVTTRTIRRWLTELKLAGILARIIRRGRTSARYELDDEMSTRMSTQEPKNVHSKPFYPLTDKFEKVRVLPERKPPQKQDLPYYMLRALEYLP
jgi:hypothetical protein